MSDVATRVSIRSLHPLFVAEITGIDLVIWDNRCTLHRGTTFDKTKYRRTLHRTTVAGTVPESVLASMPEVAVV